MTPTQQVSLPDAAIQLGMSYNQTLRLVLIRELTGRKREGRWYIDASDLKRLIARRARTQRSTSISDAPR